MTKKMATCSFLGIIVLFTKFLMQKCASVQFYEKPEVVFGQF